MSPSASVPGSVPLKLPIHVQKKKQKTSWTRFGFLGQDKKDKDDFIITEAWIKEQDEIHGLNMYQLKSKHSLKLQQHIIILFP